MEDAVERERCLEFFRTCDIRRSMADKQKRQREHEVEREGARNCSN